MLAAFGVASYNAARFDFNRPGPGSSRSQQCGGSAQEQFGNDIVAETEKWKKVVEGADLKVE
jgi:hypothetical protein